jgi:hypothetical protein
MTGVNGLKVYVNLAAQDEGVLAFGAVLGEKGEYTEENG